MTEAIALEWARVTGPEGLVSAVSTYGSRWVIIGEMGYLSP